MSIKVLSMTDREDGGADIVLDLDQDDMELLMQLGFTKLLEGVIEAEKDKLANLENGDGI